MLTGSLKWLWIELSPNERLYKRHCYVDYMRVFVELDRVPEKMVNMLPNGGGVKIYPTPKKIKF